MGTSSARGDAPTIGFAQDADPEVPPPEVERERADPGPFAAGSPRVSIALGTSTGPGAIRYEAGASAGYYLINGIELGLRVRASFGEGTNYQVAQPYALAVAYMTPIAHPYIGPFYTHYFIGDGLPDVDSVGIRLGLFVNPPDTNIVMGGGAASEWILSECDTECHRWRPEISIGISF